MIEILSGIGGAVLLLVVVYFGYIFKVAGAAIYEQCGKRYRRLHALIIALCVSAVIGVLASSDHVQNAGGDYLFDAGEVVEYEENRAPVKSGTKMFTFSFVLMAVAILRAEDPD